LPSGDGLQKVWVSTKSRQDAQNQQVHWISAVEPPSPCNCRFVSRQLWHRLIQGEPRASGGNLCLHQQEREFARLPKAAIHRPQRSQHGHPSLQPQTIDHGLSWLSLDPWLLWTVGARSLIDWDTLPLRQLPYPMPSPCDIGRKHGNDVSKAVTRKTSPSSRRRSSPPWARRADGGSSKRRRLTGASAARPPPGRGGEGSHVDSHQRGTWAIPTVSFLWTGVVDQETTPHNHFKASFLPRRFGGVPQHSVQADAQTHQQPRQNDPTRHQKNARQRSTGPQETNLLESLIRLQARGGRKIKSCTSGGFGRRGVSRPSPCTPLLRGAAIPRKGTQPQRPWQAMGLYRVEAPP
jgi:hypothetical protein